MLSVGIDFGTSNSSVAVYDGASTRLLSLDPAARDPRIMRSLIYIERSGGITYGQRALDLYLEQNTGRAVRYEMRPVGEIEMVFAEVGTLVKDVYALIDVNEPGRLFQSLKRFLTSRIGIGAKSAPSPFVQEADAVASFQATNVFGMDFRLEELLSLLAREIVNATEAALGEPVSKLTIGWPVRFSEDTDLDSLARSRLREAWRLAAAVEVSFVEEPIAAIQHFARSVEAKRREHVLVFDFGGGTLDICVARLEAGRAEALATSGAPIGGDLLDSRIIETKLAPLFGEEAVYRRTGLPLPRHLFTHLQNWQTLNELNKPAYRDLIDRARFECNQPERIARLDALASKNYGRAFFQAVESAKVELSERAEAQVSLDLPQLSLSEQLSRADFEAAVSPQVRAAQACAEEALVAAGLSPDEIGLVVTTGGSSLIPVFRRMLAETFPAARLEATDAFTSVAAGLALHGAT
jgi:hypothetical chaperone protein